MGAPALCVDAGVCKGLGLMSGAPCVFCSPSGDGPLCDQRLFLPSRWVVAGPRPALATVVVGPLLASSVPDFPESVACPWRREASEMLVSDHSSPLDQCLSNLTVP